MHTNFKKPLYSALIFFSTLGVLSIGYGAYNALSPVNTGDPLTKTIWNQMADNIADLNTRVSTLASSGSLWTSNGSNISYSAGNVGIGTTTPADKIAIASGVGDVSTGGIFSLKKIGGSTFRFYFGPTDNNLYFGIPGLRLGGFGVDGTVAFGGLGGDSLTAGPKFFIQGSTGNVGIGTSSPEKQLHIKTAAGNAELDIQTAAKDKWGIYHDEDSEDLRFWNLANVLTLQKNGHVGIGTLATAPGAMLDLRGHTSTSETQAFLGYIPNRHTGLKISTPSTNSKSRYEFFNWDGAASYSQMLLNENGNVGIGTTSPGSKLDVNGVVSSSEYRLNNASFTRIATMDAGGSYGGGYNFNWSNGVPTHDVVGALSGYGYKNNGTISLFTNSSRAGGTAAQERMTILSSGNVGIGTTNPGAKLDVSGDMLFGSRIHLDPTGQGVPGSTASFWSDSNETMYFFGNGGNTFNVRTDGNMLVDGKVGIGTTSPSYQLQLSTDSAAKPGTSSWTIASDSRLKTNISNFNDGLDIINQINPVWFNYNGKAGLPTDKKYVGIIAQDMQKIAPYTISTYKAKLNPQDTKETELLNFNESALNFVMINAIKEQQRQIQELKDEIANLKK